MKRLIGKKISNIYTKNLHKKINVIFQTTDELHTFIEYEFDPHNGAYSLEMKDLPDLIGNTIVDVTLFGFPFIKNDSGSKEDLINAIQHYVIKIENKISTITIKTNKRKDNDIFKHASTYETTYWAEAHFLIPVLEHFSTVEKNGD